jgi:hypothetical protein
MKVTKRRTNHGQLSRDERRGASRRFLAVRRRIVEPVASAVPLNQLGSKLWSIRLWLLPCLLAPGLCAAQSEAAAPVDTVPETSVQDEALSAWQYMQAVPLTEMDGTNLEDFVLTPSVFDGARIDLADLRLYDAIGREISYALRVRSPRNAIQAVADHRNPVLYLQEMRVTAAVRQVIFEVVAEITEPVYLYYGNPEAAAPNYDFAKNLPETLSPAPYRLEAGPRQDNPKYQPPPLPLTERLPWLIYALLGLAIAALGLLVANLARAAITASEARHRPAQADG